MNAPDWISIAIALLIIGAVLLVYLKGQRSGAAGDKPSRQIGKLFSEIRSIKETLDKAATTADLEAMGAEMKRVEGAAASAGQLVALEGKMNRMEERIRGQGETLGAKIDGVAQAARRTEEMVQRIDHILMKKALGE